MRISDWSSDVCSSDLIRIWTTKPGTTTRAVRSTTITAFPRTGCKRHVTSKGGSGTLPEPPFLLFNSSMSISRRALQAVGPSGGTMSGQAGQAGIRDLNRDDLPAVGGRTAVGEDKGGEVR